MSTSALPTLRQALRQLPHAVGTAGPQLQVSERTGSAGPQPGTCRVQWAPLDLNLGPSELTGPQRPDRMPEDMPDKMPQDMPDRMPEDLPDRMPEDRMPENMPEDMPDRYGRRNARRYAR